MKLIVATIRPERLEAVQEALEAEPSVGLVAVSQALDPREPCPRSLYRGLPLRMPRARLRIEVVVANEKLVEHAKRAIALAAAFREGERLGDGDILVMPLDEHVAIANQATAAAPAEHEPAEDVLPPLALGHFRS